MAYVSIAVEVDPAAITQEKIDAFQERQPGITILPGHPLYFLLEVTSDRDAQNLQAITEVTDLIWDTFGAKIQRLPRRLATQATGLSTWTRVSSAGDFTIPAGTGLSLASTTGDRVAFQTRNAVTIPAGSLTTALGEVELVAVAGGADGSNLQADPQPDETLTWLNTITVEAPTFGGDDDEDLDTFRSRLADKVSLRGDTLVLADDFAIEARNVIGVDLALAIDNYDPGPPIDATAPGHITVAVRSATGDDPGSTVRANVLAELVSNAQTNLVSHVIAPTTTTLTVVFAAKSYPGFDPADVKARAEQAVLDFLSPARWGILPFGDQRRWVDVPVVRYRDIVAVVENVDGLDYTTSLTLNAGTSDVALAGPAGVPAANSTALGTVTVP